MPIQLLVVVFIVVAIGAIMWRFLPRSADGAMRLPAVLDESLGMYVLRRALGRPTEPADAEVRAPIVEPTIDQLITRIGVPTAPPPTQPTRFVVSRAPSGLSPVRAGSPLGAGGTRRAARPPSALAAQRRWAGAVTLAVVAVALVTLALGARQLDGGVLSATGTPAVATAGPSIEPSPTAP
jgi:hypothetical protein